MQAKLTIQMHPFRGEDLDPSGASGRLKRYSGTTEAESKIGSTQRLTRIHDLLSAVSVPLEKPADTGATEGSAVPEQKFAGNTMDGKIPLDAEQFEQLVSKTGLSKESMEQLVGVSQKLGYYFEYVDVADLSNKFAAAAKAWPKDKESGALAFDLSNAKVVPGIGRALTFLNGKSLKQIEQPKEQPVADPSQGQ
jgi:hypothetical protein